MDIFKFVYNSIRANQRVAYNTLRTFTTFFFFFLPRHSSPFPVIFACGTLDAISNLYIVADYQVLFKVEGRIVEAVVSLFAFYYIFMIEYPKSLKKLFIYMQRCLFNISDSGKLPPCAMTFINIGHLSNKLAPAL